MLGRIYVVLSLFLRFGLSNKFDTEFPSVLTGKVSGNLLWTFVLKALFYVWFIYNKCSDSLVVKSNNKRPGYLKALSLVTESYLHDY